MLEKHNLKSLMWYFRTQQAVWFTVVTSEARLHDAPCGAQPIGSTAWLRLIILKMEHLLHICD